MTQTIHTVHRLVPHLVDKAKFKALPKRVRWKKGNQKRKFLALFGKEESERRYAAAKAFNIKHGIMPKRGPRVGQYISTKKVTLAKINF